MFSLNFLFSVFRQVCIHNGISADPVSMFSVPLSSESQAGDLYRLWQSLDNHCSQYGSSTVRGVQTMHWMQEEGGRRLKRAPCPLMILEALQRTDPSISKLTPVLRLVTIPRTPPKELPVWRGTGIPSIRIRSVLPDRLLDLRGKETARIQLFTENILPEVSFSAQGQTNYRKIF